MSATVRSVMEHLRQMPSLHDVDYEIRKLEAIREWALGHIGIDYTEGDQVVITSSRPSTTGGGWRCYSEALAVGQTGVVSRIDFNPRAMSWTAVFMPDVEWSVHEPLTGDDGPRRYWNGPASETPEGYIEPSKFNQEHYPNGKRHTFHFDATWLRKATP